MSQGDVINHAVFASVKPDNKMFPSQLSETLVLPEESFESARLSHGRSLVRPVAEIASEEDAPTQTSRNGRCRKISSLSIG